MITLAKRGDLHARRQALSFIREKTITHRLFGDIKDRYVDRQGGYVRIVKKGVRKGDGAPVSIIQLLHIPEEGKKKKSGGKKDKTASADQAGKESQAATAPETS